MIAEYIRSSSLNLSNLIVVELDHRSPLRILLDNARSYTRTFFSTRVLLGAIREDGSRCEDITKLTFNDSSIDILISSDVLEHVSDIQSAILETKRVLRAGGFHLFTVPPKSKTVQRAKVIEDKIVHILEPEYHLDPLDQSGILVYWDFGLDAVELFKAGGLDLRIVDGPRGIDNRLLWKAEKPL
jgi:SAM-dependent methyltransferase